MKNSLKNLFAYVLLSVFAIAFAYPFVWMISGTLKSDFEVMSLNIIPSYITLNNYLLVFQRVPVMRALLNSTIVSISVTSSVVIFGGIVGYSLSKIKWSGSKYLTGFIVFTMLIPFQLTLIPTYLVIVKLGLTDNLLGLIMPNALTAVSIIMFRQFFLSIPDSLLEAARIDGCSELGIIFRIVFPLSRPAMITVAILTFLTSWNDVLWPLIVIRERYLMTLPQLVTVFVLGGEAETHLGAEFAASTILALPIILLYAFFQKYLIQSFITSGIKA
ncbi:MAG: carbohydrate ABC transporter permease [Bacteroidota bacterium]